MFFRALAVAAATAVAMTGAPSAAATYDAYSFVHPKKSKATHSIKLNKRMGVFHNRLRGAKGKGRKRFGFENGSGGSMGRFVTSGDTATLTGTLKNKAGQAYEVTMHFEITADPGRYSNRAGAARTDWGFYKLTSGTLISSSGELADFDLKHRGKGRKGKRRGSPAVQFGTGANGTNVDLMGVFARFRAVEQGCDPTQGKCQRFNGNLKLILDEVPGGAGSQTGYQNTIDILNSSRPALTDDGGVANVPLPAAALMLPVALGGLGIAGAVGRRRRDA